MNDNTNLNSPRGAFFGHFDDDVDVDERMLGGGPAVARPHGEPVLR